MNPIISIIVPIYNVENYLSKCIDSILSQTYTSFELILVDDGSPDRCGNICDEYAKIDNRIKVIHKENGGLSDARNAGIDIAKGNYIGFVDSDDLIHEEMYEILYKLSTTNDSDIVQCKFKSFCNHNEIMDNDNNNLEVKIYSNTEAINALIDNNQLNVNTWNKLYKRSLFDEIRFPKGKIHEDEFTTYKLFYKANNIVYVVNELYYYYQNNTGIMRASNLVKRFDRIDALVERSEFFKCNNELDLYEKSNCSLFFALTKLYFIIKRIDSFDNKYLDVVKNYIVKVVPEIKGSKKLSISNKILVDLINEKYFFINIYFYYHRILDIKYNLKDNFTNKILT